MCSACGLQLGLGGVVGQMHAYSLQTRCWPLQLLPDVLAGHVHTRMHACTVPLQRQRESTVMYSIGQGNAHSAHHVSWCATGTQSYCVTS